MLFFTKKVWITKHCMARFAERVGDSQGNKVKYSNNAIRKQILEDFQVMNIRYKEAKQADNTFRVFTKGARIYVCQETEKTIVVKTVIQQTVEQAKEFKEKYLP